MAQINTGRLVVGGLAAGLVINVVESFVNLSLLAGPLDAMLAARNLEPVTGAAIGGFVVVGFALGFAAVWTYAAIRSRFGPGPVTAIRAGLAVWAIFYVLGVGSNWLMGIAPTRLYLHTLAYTLIMMLVAAYVGGRAYKEE